jgi:aspartate 1-decarboxylase
MQANFYVIMILHAAIHDATLGLASHRLSGSLTGRTDFLKAAKVIKLNDCRVPLQ